MTPTCDRTSVPPHPLLPSYYDSQHARSVFIRSLFNGVAGEYDDINEVFSLGSGRWYRRQALRQAGLCTGMQVLDVATGTGLVAREELHLTGAAGQVTGLDVSENMLAVARRTLGLPCVQARAEALPVGTGNVAFVSMGYALRHVPDLPLAFGEFFRVLRPDGTVLLLEISRPSGRCAAALARLYFRWFIPALCRLRGQARARAMLDYYWDTIDACVSPETILAALRDAGFAEVQCRTSLGVFRAYAGRKPSGHACWTPTDSAAGPDRHP
jgi:demethylmenaquinone methyltransferase/2-methoxy-6-polyprenyl-1,4-benzoquinol methylase